MSDFDDDGELLIPTMRGNTNLDVQDYNRWEGRSSSILDDELQEDVPSTPGSGAASKEAPRLVCHTEARCYMRRKFQAVNTVSLFPVVAHWVRFVPKELD